MIYLLHFKKPFKHARHYLGYTRNLDKRILRHKRGDGSRLLRALKENNIGFVIARIWKGDRKEERRLKNFNNGPELCPICRKNRRKKHGNNT